MIAWYWAVGLFFLGVFFGWYAGVTLLKASMRSTFFHFDALSRLAELEARRSPGNDR